MEWNEKDRHCLMQIRNAMYHLIYAVLTVGLLIFGVLFFLLVGLAHH